MAGDDEAPPPLHIAMFPWLAFGHMLPFLELSKCLARRGHRISFLATPRNISRLPPELLPGADIAALITFVPLPLPSVPGLPAGAEATSDVSPGDVCHLKLAFDALKPQVTDFFLAGPSPDWFVIDFASHWAPDLVGGVPCAFFSVFIASFHVFFGPPPEISGGTRTSPEQFTYPPPWVPTSSNLRCTLAEARVLQSVYSGNISGFSDAYRIRRTVESCRIIAPRSCSELEGDSIELLRRLYPHTSVIPVGYLPPFRSPAAPPPEIMEFLRRHPPRSVLYVAFGSEAQPAVELLRELAMGLELSGLPFLWALKKPIAAATTDIAGEGGRIEVLPEGFEERNRGKGMVVTTWVPQLEILADEAVGGFLSHSGWSSVTEALRFGVPLVVLPAFGDQGINARVVAAEGFGVELKRGEEDGMIRREDVAAVARMVVAAESPEGKMVREKTRAAMSVVFGNREVNERHVDEFVAGLRELGGREEKKKMTGGE